MSILSCSLLDLYEIELVKLSWDNIKNKDDFGKLEDINKIFKEIENCEVWHVALLFSQ